MDTHTLLDLLGWTKSRADWGVQSGLWVKSEDCAASSVSWDDQKVIGVYQDQLPNQSSQRARLEWVIQPNDTASPERMNVCGQVCDEQTALAFFQSVSSKCTQVIRFTPVPFASPHKAKL